MGDTWIVDIRHYLRDGQLGRDMPTPALNIALHLGSIVAWMTSGEARGRQRTNVPCRRSPGRRRCATEIEAEFNGPEDVIVWRCPMCGDNGHIYGWHRTPWDRRTVAVEDATHRMRAALGLVTERQKIAEGEAVPVRLSASDRELLDELVLDRDYLERLRTVEGSNDLLGHYTLDDLEDMLGYVAASANHMKNSKERARLDDLHTRLMEVQRSFDDGNWNDSGV